MTAFGFQLLGHIDRFAAIRCLAAHFPSLAFLEKRTQPAAPNFVIVSQQDTQFHGILPGYGLSRQTDSDVFMNLNSARSVWTARERSEHAMPTHRLDSL